MKKENAAGVSHVGMAGGSLLGTAIGIARDGIGAEVGIGFATAVVVGPSS